MKENTQQENKTLNVKESLNPDTIVIQPKIVL